MQLSDIKKKALLFFCFVFSFSYLYSSGQIFSLKLKDASLTEALREIEKKTGYTFIYTIETIKDIQEKVSINIVDANIDEILKQCFSGISLNYTLEKKKIILKRKGDNTALLPPPLSDTLYTLKGRVLNEEDNPLSGATVVVEGKTKSTITDNDGYFIIKSSVKLSKITLSFIGYESRIATINSYSITNIKMSLSSSELDEVQTIAYGKVSKRFQTGNVTTVKAADIERQPVGNVLVALQAKVPGLDIVQNSGLPGGGVSIRIQGVNGLASGNDPLIIVDGVPYPSQLLSTGLNGGVLGGSRSGNSDAIAGNPLNFLNPSDIESVDVLKDADATAIYGSRAANGAILITTKKGKAGEIKIDINGQMGWSKIGRKIKLLNTSQYLEVRKEAFKNDNILMTDANAYDIRNLYGFDTSRTKDWQQILIGGTSNYTNVQANISGGSSLTQYLLGITYNKQTTITPGNFSDKRAAIHFNINSSSANFKFKNQFSGNMMIDDNQLQTADLATVALRLAPTAPELYNPDGSLNWAPNAAGNSTWGTRHPLSYLNSRYKNQTINIVANWVLSYRVFKGAEIKLNSGYTFLQSKEVVTNPATVYAPEFRTAFGRTASYANNNAKSWILEPQFTYDRSLALGKLQFLIGATVLQNSKTGFNMNGSGYISDLLLEDERSALTLTSISSVNTVYKYNAAFARLNYNLKDRYILNLTARRDGSSNFGPSYRFHNFSAIGLSWIFSEENFLKTSLPTLSFGKLRWSYGTTGNDQLGDYIYMDLYRTNTGTVPYQGTTSLSAVQLFNPFLHWEETKKLSVGLDLGFLKDRILLSATYARNRTGNQLSSYSLPITTGFQSVSTNVNAVVENVNWELMLTGNLLRSKDYNWTISINATIPTNKLLSYENFEKSSFATSKAIGKPIFGTKLFHFMGMNPTTGKYVFSDFNGNPTENPNSIIDKTIFKSTALRNWYGGVSSGFSYKELQLDVLFQVAKGTSQGYFSATTIANTGVLGNNQPVTVLDRWQKPGDIAVNQRYSTTPGLNSAFSQSDAAYVNSSYIRFKNASLSWKLPINWVKKLSLQGVRIYSSAQNICVWSKSKYIGFDPDTGTTSIPPLRTVTLGLQLSL